MTNYFSQSMSIRLGSAILYTAYGVVAYDWALTFGQEVELIWKQPFTIGTVLFAINRYLPFLDLSIGMHSLSHHHFSAQSCHKRFNAMIWLVVAGVIIAQLVLSLRTVAIWARRKLIIVILSITFCCTSIPLVAIAETLILPSLEFRDDVPGCQIASASNVIAIPYIAILISETVICFLSLLRTYQYLQHTDSTWIHHLHQQGFLFYCCMLVISLLNAMYPFFVQASAKYSLAFLQHAAHSVLCNHVIFLIMDQRKQLCLMNEEMTRSVALTTFFYDDMYSTNNNDNF
ncbi:hypothetical protein BJ165DRAFT_1497825, partial [Panaeolus papilionaceus]